MSTAHLEEPITGASDEHEAEIQVVSSSVVEALSRAELDKQIATAKAYPRDMRVVARTCQDLVTLTVEAADECIYALPRGGKNIEGPSARFAESVAYSYGNCRVGARVVEEGQTHITAQGFFIDLERNTAISFEVKRRITNRDGKRFDADMIGVTGNAACSIALRNAVLRGVPKPLWQPAYAAAVKMVEGDPAKLAERRAAALKFLEKYGASEVMVLATLGVDRVEQITSQHIVQIKGIIQALRDGDTTIEEAFVPEWQAIRDRDQRAVKSAVAGAGEEPHSWRGDLRKRVEALFNFGRKMPEADYLARLSTLFSEKDGATVPVNDERTLSTKDCRDMTAWLAQKYSDREPGSATPPAERSGAVVVDGPATTPAEPVATPPKSEPVPEDWVGRLLNAVAKHYGLAAPAEHKNARAKWVRSNGEKLGRLVNLFYEDVKESPAKSWTLVPPMDYQRIALWMEAHNDAREGKGASAVVATGPKDGETPPETQDAGTDGTARAGEPAGSESMAADQPASEEAEPLEEPDEAPVGYAALAKRGPDAVIAILLACRYATKGASQFVFKSEKSGRYQLTYGPILKAIGSVHPNGAPASIWIAEAAKSEATWALVCRAVYETAQALGVSTAA